MPGLSNLQRYQQQQYIKSAAIKGLGANKTIEALKGIGLGIRRTEGLKQYREYAQIPAKADLLKYVRKSYRPSERLYTRQEGWMTRDYRYTIAYQSVNLETGIVSTQHTRLISDNPMTIGEIEAEGGAISAATEYWEGEATIAFSIVSAEMRA